MEIKEQRYSSTALNGIYFWTATIHKWLRLLSDDSMKFEIIKSLQFLKQKELVDIYGYVIMPNHIHLIWKQNQLNGKEMPRGSLLKFTAHQFKKTLLEEPGIIMSVQKKRIMNSGKGTLWQYSFIQEKL